MAPEVFNYQKYDSKVDIWAAGIVIYELMMLKRPFEGGNTDVLKSKIQNLDYEKVPDTEDERLRKILQKTICIDSSQRSSALEILRLNFIAERVKKLFDDKIIDDELYHKVIDSNVSNSLKANSSDNSGGTHSKSSLMLSDAEREKLAEFYEFFKTAIKVDLLALKSEYKAGYFSSKIPNLIKGSDMDLVIGDCNIPESEIESLINNQIILNVSNANNLDYDPTDNAYYQVKLFEDPLITNSVLFTAGESAEKIADPVKLSLSCLLQAENIWNKFNHLEDNEQYENNKIEIFSSMDYLEFLYEIKILKFLKMSEYSKAQKLAIILNIYQTMILHSNIKSMQQEENNTQTSGLVESVKSLFKKNTSATNINYLIGGEKLSIYEMKHIVVRRNRKPLDAYFRLAGAGDPRINFISENDDMLLKLHIICLDPQVYGEDYLSDYRIIEFDEKSVYEMLTEYCKMFVSETVKKDENQLNIPACFRDYLADFGSLEQYLIKALLKLHNDSTLKPTAIIKQFNNKELVINYY